MALYPANKRFAFTIFDDTDCSTVENVAPVYRFLDQLGMKTTKSVWVLPNVPGASIGGSTLYDRPYLNWIRKLKGFEIALHNVRNGDAPRSLVERGLREFEDLLGVRPRVHANHLSNRDNMYWGPARLTYRTPRNIYNFGTRFRFTRAYEGHVAGAEHFWGDLCKQRIDYVRNFVVREINLDRVNPSMPYHNPAQPLVNFWFSSCEGGNVNSFCELLSETNQDRLEAEGGLCIVYTHFANGFFSNGKLHPRFEALMRRLAKKNGWFVPVSTVLDHRRQQRQDSGIPARELASLEYAWVLQKLRFGPDRSGREVTSVVDPEDQPEAVASAGVGSPVP